MKNEQLEEGVEPKENDAVKFLLLLVNDSTIKVKTNHPDFYRLGYAMGNMADQQLKVAEPLEEFLRGMNDYCCDQNAKNAVSVYIKPDPKIKS